MKRARGFTITEILVVIVIVVVLAGLLLPALWMARMHALDAECRSNMIQIGKALMLYRDDYLASNKEIHPLWLRSLYPQYLKSKDVLLCPRDSSYGAEGGKPDTCADQYPELNEGSSYMYEFNMAANCSWSWESGLTFPNPMPANTTKEELVDLDGNTEVGKTKWGEAKAWQLKHGDNWYNGQFNDGKSHAYSPTKFPIIRCFWHTDEPDSKGHLEIHNLSYMCNFFRSGTEWEKSSE